MTVQVNIDLDVSRTGSQKTVYLDEDSSNVYELRGILRNGETAWEPSSAAEAPSYVTFNGLRGDGQLVYRPAQIVHSDDTWIMTYTLRRADINAVHRVMCCFYIYGQNGDVLVTPRFLVCVDPRMAGVAEIEDEEDFTALNDALGKVAALRDIWLEDLGVTQSVDESTQTLAGKHKYWWVKGEGTQTHPGERIYKLEGNPATVTDVSGDLGFERATQGEIEEALGIS
jgi:hypothetical protein